MNRTHEKLLGMVARLKADPDLMLRQLGRWVEDAHSIDPDNDGWRVTTSDGLAKWFSGSVIAAVIAKYAP